MEKKSSCVAIAALSGSKFPRKAQDEVFKVEFQRRERAGRVGRGERLSCHHHTDLLPVVCLACGLSVSLARRFSAFAHPSEQVFLFLMFIYERLAMVNQKL